MVHARMFREEIFQQVVVFGAFFVERQVEVEDLDGREMIVHVMAEAHLAVILLLGSHLSVEAISISILAAK